MASYTFVVLDFHHVKTTVVAVANRSKNYEHPTQIATKKTL